MRLLKWGGATGGFLFVGRRCQTCSSVESLTPWTHWLQVLEAKILLRSKAV